MRYFSLFSGIGGFELGITAAYEQGQNRGVGGHGQADVRMERTGSKKRDLPRNDSALPERPNRHPRDRARPVCVGYSEIDKYAIEIYQKHFPNHKNYGDITSINTDDLPDFDLLVGGFPCQAFSIAGRRGGFEDARGTLFFEIARLAKAKRPRLLLLENVKGLLSHDGGRTFRVIIATLDELGYDLQWQVLNSKNHGVPQNRERVLIVGHLRGTCRPEVFPLTDEDGADFPDAGRRVGTEIAYTLDANYHKGISPTGYQGSKRQLVQVGTLRTHKDGKGFREVKSGLAPTIPARAREDGSGQPVILARNQRGEVREMKISGSLTKDRSGKQFSYLLQRGRGKNKGGRHAVAPALTGKSYQDNNHVVAGGGRVKGSASPKRQSRGTQSRNQATASI